MPFYRRAARSKRSFKRSPYRRFHRKSKVSRIKRISKMSKYHYKRTYQGDIFGPRYDIATFGHFTFSLSLLPNYTEFTSLYDQYRINKIVLKLYPQLNVVNYSAGNGPATTPSLKIPRIMSVIDYDDSTDLTSINEAYQYQSLKQSLMTRPHTRIFTPKVLNNIYETGVTQGYSPKPKQWIDCNDPSVPHYGVKFAMENYGVNGVSQSDLYKMTPVVTVYLSFKNVR